MNKTSSANAPGKVIITGEHFVVHGSFAAAAAINRRVFVTVSESSRGTSEIISGRKKVSLSHSGEFFSGVRTVYEAVSTALGKPNHPIRIEIKSEIPQGSGLGSSAAVCVATAAALGRHLGHDLSEDEIGRLALSGERSLHGNPSGIDVQASVRGGLILFSKPIGSKIFKLDSGPMKLIVGYTGIRRRTANLIDAVARKRRLYPMTFERLCKSSSVLSKQACDAISKGDLEMLGAIMNMNQAALHWIGVSTPEIERLLNTSGSEDVLGAKITGAGGGGSIIILPRQSRVRKVISLLESNFSEMFVTSIPQKGVAYSGSKRD